MLLGRIVGKTSTTRFTFEVYGEARKFDYVQFAHKESDFVLAQILEIERTFDKTTALCGIIGYREQNVLRSVKTPPDPGVEVLKAENEFLSKTLGLKGEGLAYLGVLDGRESIKVYLDLSKLLTKHVFVTGKSGSGKSYCVAVILEELLDKKVPLVIIDPHGEYSSLGQPNLADKEKMERFGIKPKSYRVQEFSPDIESNPSARPLKLSNRNLSPTELIHMLPAKLSSSQLGVLYSALKNLGNDANFDELIFEIQAAEDSSSKWNLIHLLEYVKRLNLFSDSYTLPSELVQSGKCSIINLRGVPPEVQEVIVYKITSDLFAERKKNNIPPFFLVVEEAQNFCPERSFGEAKSSPILRQVTAEGRKFGMGLCVISQRPSRIDKSVISQVSTQIIMKVTNPNDLKALSNSIEGLTFETENEIQNIPIGTALVTGVIDLPLFVNIRPRKSRHGGEAVDIFSSEEEGMLLVIQPKTTPRDIELMEEKPVKIKTLLVPCVLFMCNRANNDFNLLVNMYSGAIVCNGNDAQPLFEGMLQKLSPQQSHVLNIAMKLGSFKPAELFAKSGVQFSDLYDLINVLTQKGYFVKDGVNYKVSDKLNAFSNLDRLACYENPEFVKIRYDTKLDKRFGIEEAKETLAKFVELKSAKECWLVKYNVEPA